MEASGPPPTFLATVADEDLAVHFFVQDRAIEAWESEQNFF
jgi:hypothetical protein